MHSEEPELAQQPRALRVPAPGPGKGPMFIFYCCLANYKQLSVSAGNWFQDPSESMDLPAPNEKCYVICIYPAHPPLYFK